MKAKLKLLFTKEETVRKEIEVELERNLCESEIMDFIKNNKSKILKENGCNLSEQELLKAITTGKCSIFLTDYGY